MKRKVKVATFNVAFGRNTYDEFLQEMLLCVSEQNRLIDTYFDGSIAEQDKTLALRVMQIRNVAAIIQKNRPDVIFLSEFNNDGIGEKNLALEGFQAHYLEVSQRLDGVKGKISLAPIHYPFARSYATNTGLLSPFDLDRNGSQAALPGDAWGFGLYHGQYAFALLSNYEIDQQNTRSFQEFKWKDMQGAYIPKASKTSLLVKVGQPWYLDIQWQQVRLSSKNHVDVPIIIEGEQIHFLLSHPTPPVFDAGRNRQRNAGEVQFWHHYIQGKDYFYDDKGQQGGLAADAKFIVMGDLNLDPLAGDGDKAVILALQKDKRVNQKVTSGHLYPCSQGGKAFAKIKKFTHPKPERLTSTFGLAVDHLIPSANIEVTGSQVFWPAPWQKGYQLIYDKSINHLAKNVSSDHRLVWINIRL